MTEQERNALLPAGLRDILPPDAAFEAAIVERLMALIGARGYERVKPPLIEFEEGLLSGAGVALAPQTFRLMDPASQRMMGVRADITPQIARIARTRLVNSPRPLRLSYAGDVLRVRGSQLRPERQIFQVGAELIGSPAPAADAEIIALAISILTELGVPDLSVDLTVPRLVPAVLDLHDLDPDSLAQLREALDRKDPRQVGTLAGAAAPILTTLISATGPVAKALETLKAIDLPEAAEVERERVEEVVSLLHRLVPDVGITLDPVEHRGFEYHTGIGFTVFSKQATGELARGGRYRVKSDSQQDQGERATGVTIYVDAVLGTLAPENTNRRILLPLDAAPADAPKLRAGGWVTVSALEESADLRNEAVRLNCSHFLGSSGPEAV
jgi:ATP phosphoribosyltransferase regulatory subunit